MCRIYTKYPFIKQTGFSGVYSDDNNFAVLEYDKTIARVTTFSVEVNGWGMRRFAVMGSLGTVEIKPIELDVKMTKSAVSIANNAYANIYENIEVCDVSDSRDIEAAMDKAVTDFGSLDIMVHVAGGSARIAGGAYVPLTEQQDSVIDKVIKVNLYGAIWARIMIKKGTGGKILNFASAVGINGLQTCCDYAAAKGGVMSLTKSLAKELGQYRINVNAVAPGIVMRPEEGSGSDRALKTNYLGEKYIADDIADLAAFLVSDKAKFITGQIYVCAPFGMVMRMPQNLTFEEAASLPEAYATCYLNCVGISVYL